jgi:hypothetical protein
MIIKSYNIDNKTSVTVGFIGQYFINREHNLSHTSALYSQGEFEKYTGLN